MVAHPLLCFGANPLGLEGVALVGWMWLLLPLRKTCQKLRDHNNNTNKKLGGCGSEELVAQKEGSGSWSGVAQEDPNISPTPEIQPGTPEQRVRIDLDLKHKNPPQNPTAAVILCSQ